MGVDQELGNDFALPKVVPVDPSLVRAGGPSLPPFVDRWGPSTTAGDLETPPGCRYSDA